MSVTDLGFSLDLFLVFFSFREVLRDDFLAVLAGEVEVSHPVADELRLVEERPFPARRMRREEGR